MPLLDEHSRGPLRTFRQPSPGGPVVFLVHPGALPVSAYQPLVRALPESVGVHVFDLMGLPGYREMLPDGRVRTSIEEIARHCLTDLAALAPAGRTVLGGWSFGGVIAHAMAERLDSSGPLVLLDSTAPDAWPVRSDSWPVPAAAEHLPAGVRPAGCDSDDAVLLGWFAMYVGAARAVPCRIDARQFAGLGTEAALDGLRRLLVQRGVLHPDTTTAGLSRLYRAYLEGIARNFHLTRGCPLRAGTRELTLVAPEHRLSVADPAGGWGPYAPAGLRIHHCPGDHYTMLAEPAAVRVIADAIEERLAAPVTESVDGRARK
ncbi:thioesterase domain-containing protein [Streptomyces celluloflavus]|uniref:thioesterase domain-containing protein n=1 Tax=Streptomyces celluloflavus TaxID=58344 RepID=UPI0036C04DBD